MALAQCLSGSQIVVGFRLLLYPSEVESRAVFSYIHLHSSTFTSIKLVTDVSQFASLLMALAILSRV